MERWRICHRPQPSPAARSCGSIDPVAKNRLRRRCAHMCTRDCRRTATASALTYAIRQQTADGAGPVEKLSAGSNNRFPYTISPDGRLVVFREDVPGNGQDLML